MGHPAGKDVLVSGTAAKEFLVKGDAQALREFMASNNGRIARAAPGILVNTLVKLGLSRSDAMVVGSAIREGVRVITGDQQMIRKVPSAVDPI